MSYIWFSTEWTPKLSILHKWTSKHLTECKQSIIELTDVLFEASDETCIKPAFTHLGSYWTNGANTFIAITSLFMCAQETLY